MHHSQRLSHSRRSEETTYKIQLYSLCKDHGSMYFLCWIRNQNMTRNPLELEIPKWKLSLGFLFCFIFGWLCRYIHSVQSAQTADSLRDVTKSTCNLPNLLLSINNDTNHPKLFRLMVTEQCFYWLGVSVTQRQVKQLRLIPGLLELTLTEELLLKYLSKSDL